jgi:two-component system response regulator NreC
MKAMKVNIFIIEAREIVRVGLKSMLMIDKNLEIIGEATNKKEALAMWLPAIPHVIIMNMSAPVNDVINFTKLIKEKYPEVKILILTLHDYESSLIKILDGGVNGYILKDVSQVDLSAAIKQVNLGGVAKKSNGNLEIYGKDELGKPPQKGAFNITSREQDVLNLIAEGLTNIEMANKLFTSVRTIESRRKLLLSKTGTTNTATLIRFAVINGLIT